VKQDRRNLRLGLFIVFGVLISLVAPFLLRGSSSDSIDATQESLPTTEIGPVAPEENSNNPSTSLPFTVETEPPNKAPRIAIQGPSCVLYDPQSPESFQIVLEAEDPDGDVVNLDLSYSIGETVIDLTDSIGITESVETPLTNEVIVELESDIEENWVLLLTHATDPEGASSEAATVVTLADTQC